MGMSWMFLYEAYQQIGVTVASLCYYCGPVIVMILSPILFQEKLTPIKVTGFFIVFLGIVLVNGAALQNDGNQWGLFCGIMSAVMYAFMVIFNKKAKNLTGIYKAAGTDGSHLWISGTIRSSGAFCIIFKRNTAARTGSWRGVYSWRCSIGRNAA